MTKLLLFLSILGAALSGAFYYFGAERADTLESEIQNLQSQLTASQTSYSKLNSEYAELERKLADKSNLLAEATSEIAMLTARNDQLKREALRFTDELDSRVESEERLQREVSRLNTELAQLKASTVSLGEVAQFERKIAQLEGEVLRLRDSQRSFPGAAATASAPISSSLSGNGLRGKILTVGPQGSFVVLDLGYNDGIRLSRGLRIERGGKTIAKIQITEVKENLSIAHILPESLQILPQSGDLAISDS